MESPPVSPTDATAVPEALRMPSRDSWTGGCSRAHRRAPSTCGPGRRQGSTIAVGLPFSIGFFNVPFII